MIARPLMSLAGLTVGMCFAEAALPQQPPAAPQLNSAAAEFPWGDIVFERIEPLYIIEAIRFKARDETGIDWPGSDEVVVQTFDPEGDTASREFGDVDSGDTREFDPAVSCVLAVQPGEAKLGETSRCDGVGRPAPLSFRVKFWEIDAPNPFNPYFCTRILPSPETGRHGSRFCVEPQDDLIGRSEIDLLAATLDAKLPTVGDEFTETVVLTPCEEGVSACGGTGWFDGDYSFTFRVTRLADEPTTFRTQLAEAMRRSGILSQTDAIFAGLRGLRAPAPREIEPQTDDTPPPP